MLKNRPIRLLFLSLLIAQLSVSTSMAQQVKTRWYQVEIIIFKQNHSATTVKEPLQENAILPDPSGAIPLNSQGDPSKMWGSLVAFRLLGQNRFYMRNYYAKLSANRAYQPVAHFSWAQPVPKSRNGYKLQLKLGPLISRAMQSSGDNPPAARDDEDDRPPVADDSDGPTPTAPVTPTTPSAAPVSDQVNEFTGTLTISRGYYLHFNIDLAYHHRGVTSEHNKVYRMQQVRRMKSKEVHLIDHPMFGVIVYFIPIKGTEKY